MSLPKKVLSKLYRETKYLGRDIRHLLGFDENFYREARGSRIMIYHGLCQEDHTRFNPIFLKLKTFEQHLQFYKEYFNIVSLDDLYRGNLSGNKFNICITFDDGYANNYNYVLPLLRKYQLPATFFITAIREAGHDILWNDFLGILGKYGPANISCKGEKFYKGRYNRYISEQSGQSIVEMLRSGGFGVKEEMMEELFPLVPYMKNKSNDVDYWLQMTKEQIRELSLSPFVNIGSHGYYHNDLARISAQDADDEMLRSKLYLEDITGRAVKSLAFPYGTYTPDVIKSAKSAGYDQLLCMDFHFDDDRSDPTMKERFTVNPFISTTNQMYATITRNYER
jgi:peptidoglycan/xylan/chitin deacetylase (PgdA/CDA1 family)